MVACKGAKWWVDKRETGVYITLGNHNLSYNFFGKGITKRTSATDILEEYITLNSTKSQPVAGASLDFYVYVTPLFKLITEPLGPKI